MEYQDIYVKKAAKNKKYSRFLKHVPSKGLAPSKYLSELPNFSEKMDKEFKPLLIESKTHLENAIEIMKSEAIVSEFDLSFGQCLH